MCAPGLPEKHTCCNFGNKLIREEVINVRKVKLALCSFFIIIIENPVG